MKSNERFWARVAREAPAISLMVACVLVIGAARWRLAAQFRQVKHTRDVYALPRPDQMVVLSLGFRSAVADLVFAGVLVSYGIHIQEKRKFEFVGEYLEVVNELDPTYQAPYRYADTLLTLGSVKPRVADYVRARTILERGMKERPFDAQLWTQAGQFMAYLAPGNFDDEAMKAEWRMEGARRLSRSCELISDDSNLPYHCITAASLLSGAGEREATVRFLERVLTVVDDPQVRALAQGYLNRSVTERERDQVQWRVERFANVWVTDLSYVGKDALLAVGPKVDVAWCAGREAPSKFGCYRTWRAWGESIGR